MLRAPIVGLILALSVTACASSEGQSDKPSKDANAGSKDEAKAKPEAEAKDEAVPEEALPQQPPPGVKTKGNLPVRTESELAAENEARDQCVAECVESRQMEAMGADAILAECRQSCEQEHPISQVEVVPDGPPI